MKIIIIEIFSGLIVALGFVSFTIITTILGILVGKMISEEFDKKG